MAHPISIDVRDDDRDPAPLGSFVRKHRVNGRATHHGDRITVEVERFVGVFPETVHAALGHEVGHSTLLRIIEQADMAGLDRFRVEVDAWMRWANDGGNRPQSTVVGMLILDALNSYRRSYLVTEDRWFATRAMVESWSVDPVWLASYIPLEPDPDEQPPSGCGGTTENPGGMGAPQDGEQQGNQPGDEPGEGEGSGDEPSDDDSEGDGDGDGEEADDDDEEADEADGDGSGDDDDQGDGTSGSGGGTGEATVGDEPDDEPDEDDDDEPIDRSERDRWLHQTEGIGFTQQGWGALGQALKSRGWDAEDLPTLTRAMLPGNRS